MAKDSLRKKIKREKSNDPHVITVTIYNSVTHVTSENVPFFKKVSVNRIFSESTLCRFEMNVLGEDPLDGD